MLKRDINQENFKIVDLHSVESELFKLNDLAGRGLNCMCIHALNDHNVCHFIEPSKCTILIQCRFNFGINVK